MPSDDAVIKRLDRAWVARTQRDGTFELLAVLSKGLPVAIGLLVNGRVIRGVIAPDSVLTAAATKAVERPLEAFGSEWDDDLRDAYAESFARRAEQADLQRKEDCAVVDRYAESDTPPGVDNIEKGDITAFYREALEPATVVINQASLETGDSWTHVDVLTVRRDAISAWWFLDSEQGEPVSYGRAKD